MALSPYARFGQTTVTGSQTSQRQHIVRGGDSIPSIAASEFSEGYDSEHWRQLAESNSVDDLDALAVGQVLVIPPIQATST